MPSAHRTSEATQGPECVAPCSSLYTRVQYAALRLPLQRLSPTLSTSILIFTDTSVTTAGRSNLWLCVARGGPRCCSKPDCVRHGVLRGLKHRRSLVTRLVGSPSAFPRSGLPMQTTLAGCRSPTAKRDFRRGSFSDMWKCSSDVCLATNNAVGSRQSIAYQVDVLKDALTAPAAALVYASPRLLVCSPNSFN